MNTLTNAELDRIEDLHKDTKLINMPFSPDGFLFGIMHQNLPALISAARDSLRYREAMEDAMMHLRTNIDIDGNKMDDSDAFRCLDKALYS